MFAGALWLGAAVASGAQDNAKSRPSNDRVNESEIARYCTNIAPNAAEARLSYQLKALADIDAKVRDALDALDKREQETKDWVLKRQELMKAANEDLVAIYTKMAPDAAAAQINTMNDFVAAALIAKLKPQAAAAILNEMDPEKASRLTTLIAGSSPGDNKS